jgi:hypothetical protein
MPYQLPGAGEAALLVKTTGCASVPCVIRDPCTLRFSDAATRTWTPA